MTEGKNPFPPSLSRIVSRDYQDGRKHRKHLVEDAMRSLPLLREGAEAKIPGLVHAFEGTYYDIERQRRNAPANSSRVEKELKDFMRLQDKLLNHTKGMHPDTIAAWGRGGGAHHNDAVENLMQLGLILHTAAEWAEHALVTLEAGASARGRPRDAMAVGLGETARFAFGMLTGRKPGRHYDTHAGQEKKSKFARFLGDVYAAYGLGNASAISRSRKKKRMGNNSKK
jgi:hypothetical protein